MKKNIQTIKVAKKGETFFIKVTGAGTLDNSFLLKDFFRQMIAKNFESFILCLEDCPYMDSTFLGVLVGISLRLKENFDAKLKLTGTNKYNLNILKMLDVTNLFNISRDSFFDISRNTIKFPSQRKTLKKKIELSTLQKAKHIRASHYNLMKASPACQMRFIYVQRLLSKEIKELKKSPRNK